MTIHPFRGILYNKEKIKNISKVYSPPYDIISPKQQDNYYKVSPYNVIRLELNKKTADDNEQDNIYTRAVRFLNEWLKKGILCQDEKPAIYIYGQSFPYNKKMRHTLGFIAAAKIEQSRHSQVRPHEMTFSVPKQDREKILEIVKANLSCIYTLVEDEGLKLNRFLRGTASVKPFIEIKIDEVRHTIWKLVNSVAIKKLQKIMSRKKAFIADGHHRYEAAANYRDRIAACDKNFNDNHPANYAMMYFTSIENKDLTILATHRVVKNFVRTRRALSLYFDAIPVPNKKKMFEILDRYSKKAHIFGFYQKCRFSVLKLKDESPKEKLDVAILHRLVLNNAKDIYYTRCADEAITLVDKKGYETAFFLNPTSPGQIRDISLAGEKMPHKSTYFYPKLLTGLVMRKLE